MHDKQVGERLIEKGLISEKQLENALKAQLIVGGHLSTCLIELGLVDEASLGEALSEIFGVPNAPANALMDIDAATIAMVPAKVADEFRVIPFRIYQNALYLAMVDPSHLPAVDALSFATDKRIVAWVAPELRIYQALEQYYGIPQRVRYIALCKTLDATAGGRRQSDRKTADTADGSSARSSSTAPPEHGSGASSAPSAGSGQGSGKPAVSMNPSRSIDDELSFDEHLGFDDYGKNWEDIAAALELDASAARADGPPASASSQAHVPDLDEIADRLCGVDSKDDLAEAILDYTGGRMARCILFGVQRHAATPWRSRGVRLERKVPLPVASGIFELLLGNELYRGQVPREAKFDSSYRILGIDRPSEALLVPLYTNDRLVAVFYGDGGPRGKISGETDDYVRLFRLFSPTLSLLILKTKIRDAVRPPPEVRKKLQTV